jgi:hypothetical protein
MTATTDNPTYTLLPLGGVRIPPITRYRYLVKSVGVGLFRVEADAVTPELAELYIADLIEREGFAECRRRAHFLMNEKGNGGQWLRALATEYGKEGKR